MHKTVSRKHILDKLKSLCYLTVGGTVAYEVICMKKDFNSFYKHRLAPCVQLLSPEFSHRLGVVATKYGFFPKEPYVDPEILKTKFLSFELSNPLGIAAGFDKHGDAVVGLRDLGFSIVEIGSVTPEPQPGNPKPRVFRLAEDEAVINRYGFNSDGHSIVHKRLSKIDKTELNNGLLGVNLGKNKDSTDAVNDYILGIKRFAEVADYFVVNISSPNTPGLRALQKKEELEHLLIELNKVKNALPISNKPFLLLKLAPDLSPDDKKDIVNVITKSKSKVDGLIISNTTVERPLLKHSDVAEEPGGLSGRPLTQKSTEMIREMYKLTKGKIPIIGVGGIFTGQDAYEKILAGASAVQIYTAFIYHGPPIVTKIKAELSDILEKNGYKSVSEAVGKGGK